MTCQFADELVRRVRPALQSRFDLPGALPLEIKLRLERLKLAELIRQAAEAKSDLRPPAHVELAVAV